MKAYLNIKSSGVSWFAAMPEHWESMKIGSLFSQRKVKVSDKDYAPLSVTKKGIVPQLTNAAKSNDSDNRKLVCAGDFVINSRSDRKGSCGVSELDGSVSLINIVLEPCQELNNRYVHYLLRSQPFSEEFYRYGRGIVADLWTTRFSEIKEIMLPVPPRQEQDQIVRFLDWKVSGINRLINIKKKEIHGLYQILQQAITSEMQGERIWLKRLLVSPLQYGANLSGTVLTEGLPRYIRITDIDSDGNLKKDGAKSIELQEAKQYILEDGDVLLARSGATVGKAFLYKEVYGFSAYAGYLIRAKLNKNKVLPEYFLYFTKSSEYVQWKDSVFIQATIQNISADRYGRLPVPIPSIEAQKKIVNRLDVKTKKIEVAIKIQEKEISLLQEYKTRLISDAVTGQIDLRDIAIPEYEYVEESADMDSDSADESDEAAVEEVS